MRTAKESSLQAIMRHCEHKTIIEKLSVESFITSEFIFFNETIENYNNFNLLIFRVKRIVS